MVAGLAAPTVVEADPPTLVCEGFLFFPISAFICPRAPVVGDHLQLVFAIALASQEGLHGVCHADVVEVFSIGGAILVTAIIAHDVENCLLAPGRIFNFEAIIRR